MSHEDLLTVLAILGPVAAFLAVITSAVGIYVASNTKAHVQSLDVKVDGRLTQLLAATASAAMGDGHAAGRAEAKEEQAIATLPATLPPGSPDMVQTTTTTTHTETT